MPSTIRFFSLLLLRSQELPRNSCISATVEHYRQEHGGKRHRERIRPTESGCKHSPLFLSFRGFKQKEEQFVLPVHVLAQLTGCWTEYLYPLSSRSLSPIPVYLDQGLRGEEHWGTSWLAGGALAGLFSYLVQRRRRKREVASLFLMLQKGRRIMHDPGISLLRKGRPSARHLKYRIPECWPWRRHQNRTHCLTTLWMRHWSLALQMFSTDILRP